MGKRKRYRLREVKFGRKYALKYGSTFKDSPVDEPLEESSVVTELTTAAPAPPASEGFNRHRPDLVATWGRNQRSPRTEEKKGA